MSVAHLPLVGALLAALSVIPNPSTPLTRVLSLDVAGDRSLG